MLLEVKIHAHINIMIPKRQEQDFGNFTKISNMILGYDQSVDPQSRQENMLIQILIWSYIAALGVSLYIIVFVKNVYYCTYSLKLLVTSVLQ